MNELLRLAFCRYQIKPAPRCHQMLGQSQHAVGDWIAVVMIVEQPGVDVALAQRRLNGSQIHIDYCTRLSSIRFLSASGKVSQAVRSTNRRARARILSR